ncbi:MAG: histone [Candidatus Aenigmatarchaeota archaeon]
MAKLPKATFEKILKEAGKNIRVSDGAALEFVEVVGDISRDLARDAAELARHANRKTILASDIKLAAKRRR